MKRIDASPIAGLKADVQPNTGRCGLGSGLGENPEHGCWSGFGAIADRARSLLTALQAECRKNGIVKPGRALEVGDWDGDVVKHGRDRLATWRFSDGAKRRLLQPRVMQPHSLTLYPSSYGFGVSTTRKRALPLIMRS